MRRLLIALAFVPFLVSACGGSSPTAPTPCTITPAQTAVNVSATAGSTAIPVQAGSSCAWTVTSSQPWLTITSGTGATGVATVTFSVAENTGEARTATVTIGGVVVTVTQAAGLPPVVLNGNPPNPVVGVAYNFQFTAQGATGSFTYSYETGVGFPPIGIQLNQNGTLTGTAINTNAGTFGVCVADSTGRQSCRRFTLTPQPPATTGGAANGNWSGTIVLQVGCTAPLPSNYPWTAIIRTAANGGTEMVVSVPRALVFNEVHPLTITGQRLTFTVDFDSLYTFVADFSADFRSLSGTFTGGNCNIPPTIVIPSGTWNGTKQ
jgi:hypothetical protein